MLTNDQKIEIWEMWYGELAKLSCECDFIGVDYDGLIEKMIELDKKIERLKKERGKN